MKTKFKIGDKVKIVKNNGHRKHDKRIGEICTIDDISESACWLIMNDGIGLRWERGEFELYVSDIEIILELEKEL